MVASSCESIQNSFLHFRHLEWGEIEIGKSSVGADSDSSIQDRYLLRIMTRGTAQVLLERAG